MPGQETQRRVQVTDPSSVIRRSQAANSAWPIASKRMKMPRSLAIPSRQYRYCTTSFLPDPRAVDRQKYCPKTEGPRVSKTGSRRRRLRKDGNGHGFRGPDQVRRVQERSTRATTIPH